MAKKSSIPTYKRRREKPVKRRVLGWLFKLVLAFFAITILWVLLYRFVPVPVTATMLMDENGITKDWEPLDRIDRDMVRAVIAAEDGKFCSHSGFDWDAINQARIENERGGRIRGGSTISQQVAKNAFLWQGGGYFRKGLEAYFTFLIENLWTKRRIMEVYLNVAETGIGTYGVAEGAQRYFGHGADSLSQTEAARIAAVLPQPKKRPAISPGGFTARYGNTIAARMSVVSRDGLDACVYGEGVAATDGGGAPAPAAERPAVAPPPTDELEVQTTNEVEEAPVEEPAPPEEAATDAATEPPAVIEPAAPSE